MRKVFVLAILAVLSVSCGRQPKFGAHNSISLDLKIPYYKSCRVELVQAEPGVEDFFLGTYYFDSGQFMELPLGAVKADGWLQQQLLLQKEGGGDNLEIVYWQQSGQQKQIDAVKSAEKFIRSTIGLPGWRGW